MASIRRVVTGNDEAGQAYIVSDGGPPRQINRPSGLTSTLLWSTDSSPAIIGQNDVDAGDRDLGIPPLPNGTVFRIVEFPPENRNTKKDYSYLKTDGAETDGTKPHPGMHQTQTLDYGIVISGEIVLVLDKEEVALKAGDVVVQRATNHAWSNRSDAPCRLAFILVDATS